MHKKCIFVIAGWLRVVGVLIAMDADDERRSVGLPHTDLAGISGHGPRALRQAEERQGGNQQFT